jgi:peptidoglycan hydrolase CwlO-like protein
MNENKSASPNWEEKYYCLMEKTKYLESENAQLRDQASKVGIMLEEAQKELAQKNTEITHLSGQIEAYQFCVRERR